MGSELPFVASDDWFGGFTPWDTYGIDLPPGKWELEVEVTGGVTLTCGGRCSVHPSLRHLLGHFIGPGGADPGPNPIFTNEDRFFPVSLVKYATVRGRPVHRPIWSAPPDNLSSAQTKIRVDGNARYYFSRDWNSQPVFTFWMAGVTVTANQYARITARRVDAELRLSCAGDLGQNRVTRGEELVCTANNSNDAAGELTISEWSFDGSTRTDGDLQSLEWRGIMVKGGTVQVKGRVGSGAEETATATITVVDRVWPGVPDLKLAELPASGGDSRFPSLPTRINWADDLGRFRAFREPPPEGGEQVEDAVDMVAGGPNDGLYYFRDLTFPVWARIRINDAAMARGSGFYNIQESKSPSGTVIGGPSWCPRSVVTNTLPDLVRAHEVRHAEVYRERYGEVIRVALPDLETMTGSYIDLADRYDALRAEANAEGYKASLAIHQLSGNPNNVQPSDGGKACNLKNEDGDLLIPEPTDQLSR